MKESCSYGFKAKCQDYRDRHRSAAFRHGKWSATTASHGEEFEVQTMWEVKEQISSVLFATLLTNFHLIYPWILYKFSDKKKYYLKQITARAWWSRHFASKRSKLQSLLKFVGVPQTTHRRCSMSFTAFLKAFDSPRKTLLFWRFLVHLISLPPCLVIRRSHF